MIDLHCHILPGIDDGPDTIDDTLALARAAVAAGTRTIVATSHVSPRYPNSARAIALGVAGVNARLRAERIPLDVLPGGEVAPSIIGALAPGELESLRLGGGAWLLVESPFTTVVDSMPILVGVLRRAGHQIVLAHPERCPGFHRRPDLLAALIADHGVLTSVTAGALVGRFGRDVERFALEMARHGQIHNVASDAHDCDRRPPAVPELLDRCGLGEHIQLLTEAMPRAILEGTDMPEHPGILLPPARRRWRGWSEKYKSG
jgi:protein-tyrosine phosphatase